MKNNVYTRLLGLVVIIMITASCSSVKVTSDYDKSVDFTKYKTFEYYGWAKESDKMLNDLDKRRIEDAFGNEFKKRGMSHVQSDGDLIVTLFIVIQDKTQTTANTSTTGGYGGHYGGYYGYGPGYGWGPSHSTTTVSTYEYQVGTLVCDVYNKSEERLIWEGIGSGTVDENPNSRDKKLPEAIAKIMAQYPVAPAVEGK